MITAPNHCALFIAIKDTNILTLFYFHIQDESSDDDEEDEDGDEPDAVPSTIH